MRKYMVAEGVLDGAEMTEEELELACSGELVVEAARVVSLDAAPGSYPRLVGEDLNDSRVRITLLTDW